jgi:hypothetical protein
MSKYKSANKAARTQLAYSLEWEMQAELGADPAPYYFSLPNILLEFREWLELNPHTPWSKWKEWSNLSSSQRWIISRVILREVTLEEAKETNKVRLRLIRYLKLNEGIGLPYEKEGVWFEELRTPQLAERLVNLGIKDWWEVKRFLPLWEGVRAPGRVWNSGHQPDHSTVLEVALTPNYNRLPIWVKRVLVRMPVPTRIGNVWDLIPAVRVWKYNTEIPKSLAVRLGTLYKSRPDLRALAGVIWKKEGGQWDRARRRSRTERICAFWQRFNQVCHSGRTAIAQYLWVSGHKRLALRKLYGELSWAIERPLLKAFNDNEEAIFGEEGYIPALKVAVANKLLRGNPPEYLIPLVLTFGSRSEEWLSKMAKLGYSEHDATYWLPLGGQGLSEFLFAQGERLRQRSTSVSELGLICRVWHKLSAEERSLPFRQLVLICKVRKYSHINHQEFALECANWGVATGDYKSYENKFIHSLEVPNFLPGIDATRDGIRAYFLPREDTRGLFLGEYTKCCQHPDGAGETCAWYGQQKPNSGFLVFEDDSGTIIAQSWTWINESGDLCFDNCEALGLGQREPTVILLYEKIAQKILEMHSVNRVLLGANGDLYGAPATWGEPLKVGRSLLPEDYKDYTDAKRVYVLRERMAPLFTLGGKFMCPYRTYFQLDHQTTQRRSVDGPACHINLDGHRWYVVPEDDFEVITLIE